MRICPHGETRNDKTVSIPAAQKAGCKYYDKSRWLKEPFCWRYRVGLDHCNKVDIPMEEEKEDA